MLNVTAFADCIRQNLKDRRFGKQRADEIIKEFKDRAAIHIRAGRTEADAGAMAMRETFDRISEGALEKAKRTAKMLAVQAENTARIQQGLTVNIKDKGKALGRAAVSLIEDDPRFNGLSYSTKLETIRGQMFALMNDVLEKVGKGAFGVQRGKAHLPNIPREVFGVSTGDRTAKEMADAWLKISDLGVDLFNQAGGSMRKLQRYLPNVATNAAKLEKGGFEAWAKLRDSRWDWGKMYHPDGKPILPTEREAVMRDVFNKYATDGAIKIDDKAFRGQGRAMGNMLDNHRFVHYKDAEAWLADLDEFGDGNPFDVMVRHIEDMSHRIALVDTFGPNPDLTFTNIEAIVRKAAAGVSAKDKTAAEAILKNKFKPMMELVTRKNPMNPESFAGNITIGTSNLLTAAQLGSASLLAIPGDFMQSVAVRAINHMDLFGGINHYVKAIATDRAFMSDIATQSGFVMDEAVMSTYAATRFTGVATLGPAITRRVSDGVMRASMLAGHTKAARWASQAEFMGLLRRMNETGFDDLPFNSVLKRYGISPAEWDAFRTKVAPWSPRSDIKFLRPIDILNTNITNKQELYRKFQGMVFEESRKMVPESTIEATASLKGTTRPDTLAGLILHSFAMYKNFPLSFWMIYGRLGMTSPSVKGKLGFYAGLGAGMTMVGAMGTQMREIASGRDPMAMDSPAFLGKAFLSGGALSIWGDFLFSGVNRMGGGATDTAAGPIPAFLGDTAQLAFGDAFKWANTVGTLDEKIHSTTGAKAVEYLRRYTPGSNIWWARLALERQVWDRLQELADPKVYQKRRNKERNQLKTYGNESWWPAGERTPERLPQYNGR